MELEKQINVPMLLFVIALGWFDFSLTKRLLLFVNFNIVEYAIKCKLKITVLY